MGPVQLQGISDQIAARNVEQHGSVTYAIILSALNVAPSCPRLASYWHFAERGYRKVAWTCAEPSHLEACPLPVPQLRKGTLNQAGYSLSLFVRDFATATSSAGSISGSTRPILAMGHLKWSPPPRGRSGAALRGLRHRSEGLDTEGRREIVGLHIGLSEAAVFWTDFLRDPHSNSTAGRLTYGRSNSTSKFHLIDGHDLTGPFRFGNRPPLVKVPANSWRRPRGAAKTPASGSLVQ